MSPYGHYAYGSCLNQVNHMSPSMPIIPSMPHLFPLCPSYIPLLLWPFSIPYYTPYSPCTCTLCTCSPSYVPCVLMTCLIYLLLLTSPMPPPMVHTLMPLPMPPPMPQCPYAHTYALLCPSCTPSYAPLVESTSCTQPTFPFHSRCREAPS